MVVLGVVGGDGDVVLLEVDVFELDFPYFSRSDGRGIDELADCDHGGACGGIVGGDLGAGFRWYEDADFCFLSHGLDGDEGVFLGVAVLDCPLPEGAEDFEGVVI